MPKHLLPLAPPGERRGFVYKAFSTFALVTLAFVLLVTSVGTYWGRYFLADLPATPVEVYHNTWRVARDNIYDQSKLKNWDSWEHKFDSQIKTDEDALRFANEMLSSLDESYTALLPREQVERDKARADGAYVGVGIVLDEIAGTKGFIVKRVIAGGPADRAGLLEGDVIVAVDGTESTKFGTMEALVGALKGPEGNEVTLTVSRGVDTLTMPMKREKVKNPVVTTQRLTGLDGKKVGYIRIESFDQLGMNEQVEKALVELADCDQFVVDLRDNPGGFIHEAVLTSALFMKSGTVTKMSNRFPGEDYLDVEVRLTPGQIMLTAGKGYIRNIPVPFLFRPRDLVQGRSVVLLVNGNSASAAEMFSAALIDNGVATAVGTTTFGKGIGQTYIPVGNGHRLRVTNIKAYTPSGAWLGDAGQTVASGITPLHVTPSRGWFRRGGANDNQLNKALEVLQKTP